MNSLSPSFFNLLIICLAGLCFTCGKPGTDDLISKLSDERSDVRRIAAYALIDAGESSVVPLIKTIADAPDTVRYIGAQILGRIGSPKAANILLILAHDPNFFVQQEALRALGKIHRPELIDTLIHFSAHAQTDKSRAAAVEGLSSLRDSSIVPTIITLMNDPSPLVRKEALSAIGKQWMPRAEQSVIDRVSDIDETVRYIAVQLCGVRKIKKARLALHMALNDPSVHVRTEVTKSLSLLRDTTAIPLLVKMIKKFDGPDTKAALKTLRELTGDEYIIQ
ncbi:MAG: HEAT repeat domain-containing protein [Candidatus Latescibacterota bacterium]|nr:HEAT repeat domain-containing protein [Candidatus Latescibacterota bacterium]